MTLSHYPLSTDGRTGGHRVARGGHSTCLSSVTHTFSCVVSPTAFNRSCIHRLVPSASHDPAMSSPDVVSVRFDKENVNPRITRSTAKSTSAATAPIKEKRAASTLSASSASDSSTTEPAANKKKRKQSSTAPRTLTKEELADNIARDEFWQKCEAAVGDGDGYEYGRGNEQDSDNPVYDDCNEVRRKLTAFFKTGRMTQAAWCRLVGINSSSLVNFMKAKVEGITTIQIDQQATGLTQSDESNCLSAI